MSNKIRKKPKLSGLSKVEKEALEQEGLDLLNLFVSSMEETVDEVELVQKHYLWAKKFMCKSKAGYMLYVNSLMYDKKTHDYINNKVEGLPEHMYNMIVSNVSQIKQ
jgi:hypothetical protein